MSGLFDVEIYSITGGPNAAIHPSAYLQNLHYLFVHRLFQQKDQAYQGTLTFYLNKINPEKPLRFKPNKHSSWSTWTNTDTEHKFWICLFVEALFQQQHLNYSSSQNRKWNHGKAAHLLSHFGLLVLLQSPLPFYSLCKCNTPDV